MKLSLFIYTLLFSSILFGQSTWYEIPTGTTKGLNAIDFPSVNVGYIVGQDSTMLKTTDGGQTWSPLEFNGIQLSDFSNDFIGVQFYDVHFVDENIGFVLIRASSSMIHTIDGGMNWTVIDPTISSHSSVYAWSSNDYLVGGAFGWETIIKKTTNGVTTTSALPSSTTNSYGWVNEMSFANSNLGLAAMNSQYFLRTIDGGSTWDTIPTSLPSTSYLESVVMVNDQLCYAVYNDGGNELGILKSLDGGLTWQFDISLGLIASSFYSHFSAICAAQNGDVYSGGFNSVLNQPVIFEKENGMAWSSTSVIRPMYDMASCGPDITFGVGDSGYLVVNTPIADLEVSPLDLVEFDVYPNPVLNQLTINNPLLEAMEVTILDVRGKVLASEKATPGLNTINVSNFSRGMYFIKAQIGNKVGLKKIIK